MNVFLGFQKYDNITYCQFEFNKNTNLEDK